MKRNLTEIIFILDASGSMYSLTDDTIGGFNSMLNKQKKQSGEAYVTTIFFNTRFHIVHDRLSINKVPDLTHHQYQPNGCTALLDTIGFAIKHFETIYHYANKKDLPSKTIFIINTDGMENASHRYTAYDIKDMINHHKRKDHWEFLFIGANIDAIKTAQSFGIDQDHAANYHSDEKGTEILYRNIDRTISNIRTHKKLDATWKDELERDYKHRR